VTDILDEVKGKKLRGTSVQTGVSRRKPRGVGKKKVEKINREDSERGNDKRQEESSRQASESVKTTKKAGNEAKRGAENLVPKSTGGPNQKEADVKSDENITRTKQQAERASEMR